MAAVMKINAFQDQWNLYTTSSEQVTNLAQEEKFEKLRRLPYAGAFSEFTD